MYAFQFPGASTRNQPFDARGATLRTGALGVCAGAALRQKMAAAVNQANGVSLLGVCWEMYGGVFISVSSDSMRLTLCPQSDHARRARRTRAVPPK